MAARFDAFISYSRAASSTLAIALRGGIERFAKPWYRLRSSRVFLDDASMSANTGLWSNIERGLTEAEWFILLCSPRSAASEYVTNEIVWWLQHKSADRILLVLDEGEIAWDAAAGDFDWPHADAVNPALSKAYREEPRWIDLSWFEAEGSLRDADPRFPERVADLAAAIRFQERDELVGENVRERRRALRLLRGGVIALSGLLVASLVATVIAVANGNAAAEQARIALARQLAAQAITLSTTDLQTASLLAVEAQRMHDDPQTQAALFQLATASPHLVRTLPVGAAVTATAIAADGTVFTGDRGGVVARWDGDQRTDLADLNASVPSVSVSDDGTYVAAVSDDGTIRVMTPGGDVELTGDPGRQANLVALSPDGSRLAISDRYSWLTLYERDGADGFVPAGSAEFGGRVAFGDGELTTFAITGVWARISLMDASVLDSGQHTLGINANGFAVSRDGRVLTGSPGKSVQYAVWDTVGSVSDGGSAPGDPPDRVSTSQVAGKLDIALNDDGSRLAVMDDGAIYVSKVRAATELPEAPLALLGAGAVEPETLAFRGDTIVNGTEDFALVWDLAQTGRIADEFEAPVPEGCAACGPAFVSVSPGGTRALMWAVGGGSPVVVDLAARESTVVDEARQFGLATAGWWDADRFLVSSTTEQVLFLTSADTLEVEKAITLPFEGTPVVLAISADSATDRVTVLTDDGGVTVLGGDGTVLARNQPFEDLLDAGLAFTYGVAPDGSTAFVYTADADGGVRMVDAATGETRYESRELHPAAYDGRSRLHIFADGRETVLDAAGTVVVQRTAKVEIRPLPALSANGELVASGGPSGSVNLLDLGRGGAVFGRVAVPVQDNRLPVSAFSSDGTALITAIPSMDSLGRPATLRSLTLRPADWRAAACAIGGRDLTSTEWRDFIATTPPTDLRCRR